MGIRFQQAEIRWHGSPVLTGITCQIPTGSLCLCVGPNGSGKSTFLRSLVGDGSEISHGMETDFAPHRIAYLPQNSNIDRQFPVSVREFLEVSSLPSPGQLDGKITDALHQLGLEEQQELPLEKLSGGQFQRLLLARILIQDSDLVLLDEPFNFLDQKSISQSLKVIEGLRASGRTVILAVHHEALGKITPDLILHFNEGRVTSVSMNEAKRELGKSDCPVC